MTAAPRPDVTVVGAGLTGLTTALLLARSGHRVTVLDRDAAAPPEAAAEAWAGWDRPGVSQFRQPHLMLPRWHQETSRELPELTGLLLAGGARRVNLLHLQPAGVTGGWQPGDEQFGSVAARRPVLEAVLGRLASEQPGLTLRRGVRATGLLVAPGPGVPHVVGLRTTDGDLATDLVVDAAGRRTPVPGWVRALGGRAPVEVRESSGFAYYSRHFRSPDRRTPDPRGSVLTHHPSMSVLTLPGDDLTWCVVLVVGSRDRALRCLRHEAAWSAAVRCSPVAAHWPDAGEPLTGVMPLAGVADITRSYLRDGEPVVTGVVAVGDSAAATNPSLGRGAAIGVIHACALRDVLASGPADRHELALRLWAATAERVTPWVEATTRFDRHRLAEIEADVQGRAYRPDDPTWAMTTALMQGALRDPVLARASARIAGLLAAPPEVFSDSAVQSRLGPHLAAPRYPSTGPTRADLLAAVEGAFTPVTA